MCLYHMRHARIMYSYMCVYVCAVMHDVCHVCIATCVYMYVPVCMMYVMFVMYVCMMYAMYVCHLCMSSMYAMHVH